MRGLITATSNSRRLAHRGRDCRGRFSNASRLSGTQQFNGRPCSRSPKDVFDRSSRKYRQVQKSPIFVLKITQVSHCEDILVFQSKNPFIGFLRRPIYKRCYFGDEIFDRHIIGILYTQDKLAYFCPQEVPFAAISMSKESTARRSILLKELRRIP